MLHLLAKFARENRGLPRPPPEVWRQRSL